MERSAIRDSFQQFAGTTRYRKFVHVLNTRCSNRLFHWQEQLWNAFVAAEPAAILPFEDLKQVFLVCELHGGELQPETAAEFALPQSQAASALFPYACSFARRFASAEEVGVEVYYCPECRRLERDWAILPRAERAAALRNSKRGNSD